MAFVSGILGGYIYGELNAPSTQFFEWDVREASSPAGTRDIYAGHPAWVKELGVESNKALEFEDVIMDYANDDLSGVYPGRVQCWTIGLTNDNFSISNLRLWMPSGTALNSSGHLEFAASGTWFQNPTLPSGNGTVMPTALPALQNIIRQDDIFGNLDFSQDSNVSQFVYMGLSVTSGMPLGQYGLNSNGDLAFRVTYDWYYKFQASGSMT
jgi:hypothetical protein